MIDTTFDADFGTLIKQSMPSFAKNPNLGYKITVRDGELVSIKQVSAITSTNPDASFTGP